MEREKPKFRDLDKLTISELAKEAFYLELRGCVTLSGLYLSKIEKKIVKKKSKKHCIFLMYSYPKTKLYSLGCNLLEFVSKKEAKPIMKYALA